ncbi:MAG TPA: hypothetical protein VK550_20485 [Polyangiaceae bacterium]|jgi:hypothetical protein|nr:hypothetical protein [Polyangiaceae bacterium]
MSIKFELSMKLQLWVWDSGELEGWALYLNDELIDEQDVFALKYDIESPDPSWAVVVHFAGDDGGGTKIVNIASGKPVVLERQDSGLKHSYIIAKETDATEEKK